jgi:hypothetical protein
VLLYYIWDRDLLLGWPGLPSQSTHRMMGVLINGRKELDNQKRTVQQCVLGYKPHIYPTFTFTVDNGY